jgi:HK97 gp10 family phage protein
MIFKDNTTTVLDAIAKAKSKALESIGETAERFAIDLAPSDTTNLQQNITHQVDVAADKVYVGTDVEYAPYVELGTGIHAEGGGGRPTPWVYQDAKGNWHYTHGQEPQPFLRPAAKDHKQDYAKILEDELQQALK